MKLLTLVSIFALTAASGAFAQSQAPMHNENPNNCSDALRNCGGNTDGSNTTAPRAVTPTPGATQRTMHRETHARAQAPGTDPRAERATAAQHAGLAVQSTDLAMTQMHLHHVVNCLVGPTGKGFDAAAGNPCKDQGTGAISDTMSRHQRSELRHALARANAGLTTTDIAVAQKDAARAQTLLTPRAPKAPMTSKL